MRRLATLIMMLVTVPGLATPARAATLPGLLAEYDALERETRADDGPGWPDVSYEAAQRRSAHLAALDATLAQLPPSPAGSEDELTRELLTWRLATEIEGYRFDEDRIPFDNGDGFFNTANYAAANTVLHGATEARAWIERLRQLPRYYAQQTENLRRGIRTGWTQPRPTCDSVLAILRTAEAQPSAASPLLAPLGTLPATVPADVRAALRTEALAAIDTAVKPAQRALREFFEREYLPHARTELGAGSLPDGARYYAFAVRRSTTTNLSPDEVFALGEQEIRRLRAEMESAMRATGYAGTLPEFIAWLRTDRRFYATDFTSYLEKASEIGKRADGQLPRFFGKLPRLTWGLKIKPPELEASSSGYDPGDPAHGVAGHVVLGPASAGDPLFALPAWVLHEGVPGHHLQIALAQERTDLPEFRRRDDVTAFVEGWGLYTESLGEEMGMYRDAYERFGRLSWNIWRACRLVMDVGIHLRHWSAEQAAACLRENTTLPERVVNAETQRYIAWPAQALAYKVGELRILALRRQAETTLGDRFDLRAFHDALLDDGPLPLPLLEARLGAWIRARAAGP